MERKLLRTDYKDAVFEGLRKYRTVNNGDGTVSFVDVTDYTVKEGSFFGAEDANAINAVINDLSENVLLKTGGTVSGLTTFQQGNIAYEYIHSVSAGGFLKLATFKITEQFEFPIEFYIAELAYAGNVYIRFAKDGDGYSLAEFSYSGNIDALNPRMHQSDADTWDFYIWLRGWSAISVSDLKINSNIIKGLNNGHGITWNYDIYERIPSRAVSPTLRTYNIQLKDTERIWEEIYNLKSLTSLKNYIKQVEVKFNNSATGSISTSDFLAGSALDVNGITIQGLICTGIGAVMGAGFTADKKHIVFHLGTNSNHTGTIKADVILLYNNGAAVGPPDYVGGGEIQV